MKYFKIEYDLTIDAIKKEYKRLAFLWHPDITKKDTNKEMAEIANEYEMLLNSLGKEKNKNYKMDYDYISIIDDLIKINMEGVDIEVCGWFVYLTGNTKPYKEQFKELKLRWNSKKVAWYWKPDWYVKKGKEVWNMDKIRETWGSSKVYQDNQNNQDKEREQKEASSKAYIA